MTKDELINLLRITGAQEASIDAVCAAYDAGWNDALDDYAKRIEPLPFGKDGISALTMLDGNQVARRLNEMKIIGLIQLTGNTVKSNSGRNEREWQCIQSD